MTRWHGTTKLIGFFPTAAPTARARLRLADVAGDVGVGGGAAHRDAQQRLPHPHLEVGADQHHAKRPVLAPELLVEDARAERRGARGILDVSRPRPAAAHIGDRGLFLAGVGEREPAEAAIRRHHQRGAEQGGMEAIVNRQAFAAGFPFAGRHRLVGDEQVVQASGAGQADLVGGVEHARGIAQQIARAVEGERLQERFRRQPGPAAEQVVQLGRRDAGGFGDLFDLRLRAPVAADVSDGAAHDVVIGGGGGQRHGIGYSFGREHGGLHHVALHLGRQGRQAHPISDPKRSPVSARAGPRPAPSTARRQSFPAPSARGSRRPETCARATPETISAGRTPRWSRGRAWSRAD